MTKKVRMKTRIKEMKKNTRGWGMLKALQSTGLFRWEKPMTKSETSWNVWTHGIGIGIAIALLCVLECFAVLHGDAWTIVSVAIFGFTMIMLYFGSTFCHLLIGHKYESFFEAWDSISIYALIAGSYTPFLLVNMRGPLGWSIFGVLWLIVIIGAYMKIKAPNAQPKWVVGLYLLMGWTIVFILPVMLKTISAAGLWFILAGGLSYSIGTIFYLWRKLKYSHAIWHLFVMGGTICIFFAVLFGSILDYAK